MTAPDILRLYHGTSTAGFEAARTRGFLAPRDHRALAAAVAAEYGIAPKTLWAHPFFEYVRSSRSRDRHVYLTDDEGNAHYYASCLNESTVDALKTAHRILNQALIDELDAGPVEEERSRWKASQQAFIATWRARHPELVPLVLTFAFPMALLPVPEHVRDRFPDPGAWWLAATRDGARALWEIAIPEQVSLAYLVSVEPASLAVAGHGAALAA